MELNPQIIKKGNSFEYAVIPFSEFLRMKELIDDYEDLLDLRKAKEEDLGAEGISAEQLLKEIAEDK